jgi:hypothetical protein
MLLFFMSNEDDGLCNSLTMAWTLLLLSRDISVREVRLNLYIKCRLRIRASLRCLTEEGFVAIPLIYCLKRLLVTGSIGVLSFKDISAGLFAVPGDSASLGLICFSSSSASVKHSIYPL